IARRFGLFMADATEETRAAADTTLGHRIITGDELVDSPGIREPVHLEVIFVLLPERWVDGLAFLDEHRGLPDRDLAPRFHGVPHQHVRIDGPRAGPNVVPATVRAVLLDIVIADGRAGFEKRGELLERQ